MEPGVPVRRVIFARDDALEGVKARLFVPDRVASMGARQAGRRGPASAEQGFVLRHVRLCRLGALSGLARIGGVVVEALRDEDDVGYTEVACQCRCGRGEARHEGT